MASKRIVTTDEIVITEEMKKEVHDLIFSKPITKKASYDTVYNGMLDTEESRIDYNQRLEAAGFDFRIETDIKKLREEQDKRILGIHS